MRAMLQRGLSEDGAAQALGWAKARVTARVKILELPEAAQQLVGVLAWLVVLFHPSAPWVQMRFPCGLMVPRRGMHLHRHIGGSATPDGR